MEEQEELDRRPRITDGATIPPDKFQERVFKHMVDDLTDSLGITYKDGHAPKHHDPLYYEGYEQHNYNYKWDRLSEKQIWKGDNNFLEVANSSRVLSVSPRSRGSRGSNPDVAGHLVDPGTHPGVRLLRLQGRDERNSE